MRATARLVVMVAAALAPAAGRAPASDERTTPSVAAVRIESDAGETRGTAVLIHREDAQGGTTLYFLTSARLFRGPDGNYRRISKSVTLKLDATRSLAVKANDVFSEGSGFVDVAILRATTTDRSALRPTPVVYDPPPVGAEFVLSGLDETGSARTMVEHVRFESTLLVVGDRDATPLADCVGTPAVTAEGVFGIVRECSEHRSPVISLLAMASSFLERHIPRQSTETHLIERRERLPLRCGSVADIAAGR